MAARTFEDSAGETWEVFEVHRASDSPGAVSAGLERGWLSFTNGDQKRRLAPFPPDWEMAATSELERLCAQARIAASRIGEQTPRPRIRPAVPTQATPAMAAAPVVLPPLVGDVTEIEAFVRAFAHEARTLKMPAVEAMVRMKAALLERFPGAAHAARDSRLVRRAFVDAYYFEREA
jgi:hypothetical protein